VLNLYSLTLQRPIRGILYRLPYRQPVGWVPGRHGGGGSSGGAKGGGDLWPCTLANPDSAANVCAGGGGDSACCFAFVLAFDFGPAFFGLGWTGKSRFADRDPLSQLSKKLKSSLSPPAAGGGGGPGGIDGFVGAAGSPLGAATAEGTIRCDARMPLMRIDSNFPVDGMRSQSSSCTSIDTT